MDPVPVARVMIKRTGLAEADAYVSRIQWDTRPDASERERVFGCRRVQSERSNRKLRPRPRPRGDRKGAVERYGSWRIVSGGPAA
jgi:hypothetical protein